MSYLKSVLGCSLKDDEETARGTNAKPFPISAQYLEYKQMTHNIKAN